MTHHDRNIRRLTALDETASTSRVLNLLRIHRDLQDRHDFSEAPFFQNTLLDRCIILKHRLRREEFAYFRNPDSVATKIIVPFDQSDLRVGARTVFVGQIKYHEVMSEIFGKGMTTACRDMMILDLIAFLPTLDPFILREHLKTNGIEPARVYFSISDNDLRQMFDFVRREIMALASLTAAGDGKNHGYANILVEKLLSTSPSAGFEPLRETLKMESKEYADGIFCWRGFLYYKWLLDSLMPELGKVMVEIGAIHWRGPAPGETQSFIGKSKVRIQHTMMQCIAEIQAQLDVYDRSYTSLVGRGDPKPFRDFLLSAPGMFGKIGDRIGAIQHIVSYWKYRFPTPRSRLIGPDELMDVLLDFESGLGI